LKWSLSLPSNQEYILEPLNPAKRKLLIPIYLFADFSCTAGGVCCEPELAVKHSTCDCDREWGRMRNRVKSK
jgi:hypothetical protein